MIRVTHPRTVSAWDFFKALPPGSPKVLLESARPTPGTGRFSMVAWDPFLIFESRGRIVRLAERGKKPKVIEVSNPFDLLERHWQACRVDPGDAITPFANGAVGYASYEAGALMDPGLSWLSSGDPVWPDLYYMFTSKAAVWDSERVIEYRYEQGRRGRRDAATYGSIAHKALARSRRNARSVSPKIPPRITLSMTRDQFKSRVQRIQRHIRAGDIYQANLSHAVEFPLPSTQQQRVYEALKKVNPSPFFGFLDAGPFQILSGSPERLLKLADGELETRPIAGTRRRGSGVSQDRALGIELLLNEKERAEHVMLVDLERNDLGRVCEYGSVEVSELMALEDYSHVKHIVSNVRGRLSAGRTPFDAFRAFFPGGTITGAPKISSMQVLKTVEDAPRGPYTGSLGYFSFTGNMDFNILIRSLFCRQGKARLNVGAGIVADSDPDKEYDETLHKASAVLEAVFGKKRAKRLIARCAAPDFSG